MRAAAVAAPPPDRGPLAPVPRWSLLEPYQGTIARAEFERLLDRVYAPRGAAARWIELAADHAAIVRRADGAEPPYRLRFAPTDGANAGRGTAGRDGGPPAATRPLSGLHIALDPGHLGGRWARMEERWFLFGAGPPITEGDHTLTVSRRLAAALRALGAEVSPLRFSAVPTTGYRPWSLRRQALAVLAAGGRLAAPDAVRRESERLFYRVAEIRARARYVNRTVRPDLVVCLHFNAAEWGAPERPTTVAANHLHTLVNGCYLADELALEDVRIDMLLKLLGRTYEVEVAAADAVAESLAAATGLPAYTYSGNNAVRVGRSGYVWARNLLANRLYRCPTVFVEPYVMNHPTVARRLQAGDYDGRRTIDGRDYPSIFREYAAAVADGLAQWAAAREPPE